MKGPGLSSRKPLLLGLRGLWSWAPHASPGGGGHDDRGPQLRPRAHSGPFSPRTLQTRQRPCVSETIPPTLGVGAEKVFGITGMGSVSHPQSLLQPLQRGLRERMAPGPGVPSPCPFLLLGRN